MNLKSGDRAPDFSLEASTGETVALSDLRGKKVVLYFYPKDDTPGCIKEACSFRDSITEIEETGAVVLGVSADNLESHDAFIEKYQLNFPLLADEDKKTINDYGVWGEKVVNGKKSIGIRRMTFLIDEAGNVQTVWPQVTPDDHASEVMAAIKG